MELASTIVISGEEREIADAVAREQVDGINSNLDGLAYGENGAKNLFKDYDVMESYALSSETYNGYPIIYSNSAWHGAYQSDLILKSGVTYTISAYVKGSGRAYLYTSENAALYSKELTDSFERFSFTYTPTKNISKIRFENNTNGGLYIACFQIEERTTASDYKPYIPSVKMLAEEVDNVNESLADYGLDNKFDGVLKQGYYTSSGQFMTGNHITTTNAINVKAGSKVKVKYDGTVEHITIAYFNGNMFVSRSLDVYYDTVPQNATNCYVTIQMEGVTPQNAEKLSVYVDNAIAELKNDLSKQCKKDDITTNETLIGTFNGKNYYRKLFTGISGSGGSVTVNVGEKIEIYNYYGRAYVYGQSGASNEKYPIPNMNYYIESQNSGETSFQLTIPTSSDTRKVDLVIEYTKVDE